MDIPPQLEELIKAKVQSGLYDSPSEVMREALYLLDEHDHLRAIRLERLKTEIRKGIDSGTAASIDMEAKIARLEKTYAARQDGNET